MADYKSDYLQEVLETHRMKHVNETLEQYRAKRREIRDFLITEYGTNIYEPFNSGSYKKFTAINTKFDLDLIAPFKYSSFSTLESMFNDVSERIKEVFGVQAVVRDQGVSIGIVFTEDEINIDVVPARETSKGSFDDTHKDLNLHKFDGTGYLKTNIHKQIDHIKSKNNERRVVRLLKIWKSQKRKKYKSFFFELLAIKAYESTSPTGNLWNQFSTVLQYIVDNIEKDTFKLPDPGNGANDLISTLEPYQKSSLRSDFELMLTNIKTNEKQIEYYFEKNKEFSEEASNNSLSYGVAGAIPVSTPSSKQRFG
ncbi:nucleotidyltransferase [Psychrobacter celer]|uniref:nucleotidyltransferase domain-containing protein n=1 Tax=Psychrobacter celer TaxID=306572 RepID=UPI002FE43B3E